MMKQNLFYGAYDYENSGSPRSYKDHRTPFQVDRDRILFSYPFRRLQSKTQVFQSGEYDFYRTRLTHTIEVARIARSICDYLNIKSPALSDEFYIDPDLVEAVGFAHDLGHPPFGHIGERKLNKIMECFGGFEGNAQTLRILNDLIFEKEGAAYGMHATRSLLDGVLKYKALQEDWIKQTGQYPENHFLYDTQKDIRDFALGADICSVSRDPRAWNALKSIECQIMDWADDTAYSLHDIVDGVKAGFISTSRIEKWALEQTLSQPQAQALQALQAAITKGTLEQDAARSVGECIRACTLSTRGTRITGQTHRYDFVLEVDPSIRARCELQKKIAVDLVFKSPTLQQIELKGGCILEKLFECYREQYLGANKGLSILPEAIHTQIVALETETDKMRAICDYVSGLTDLQAMRAYKRLFSAEYGSIMDLI